MIWSMIKMLNKFCKEKLRNLLGYVITQRRSERSALVVNVHLNVDSSLFSIQNRLSQLDQFIIESVLQLKVLFQSAAPNIHAGSQIQRISQYIAEIQGFSFFNGNVIAYFKEICASNQILELANAQIGHV